MWKKVKLLKRLPDYKEIVNNKVRKEWESFIHRTLLYDKETIINMCDKIHFYHCVVIFFLDNNQIPEKVYTFLLDKDKIIFNMWLLYLKQEHLGLLTWAELAELLKFWMKL